MRKPAFCICENKDADQLRRNREADQRLCFRYSDSTIPLFPTSEISSLLPCSVAVQPGLCRNWSETPKTVFLTTRLIWKLKTDQTGQLPRLIQISHSLHCEENGLRGFRPGPTQSRLYNHTRLLEACNFVFRK